MSERKPICSIGMGGSDILSKRPLWFITLLPKGYGPGPDDRVICAIPYGALDDDETVERLVIEKIAAVLTEHFSQFPPQPQGVPA